MLDTLLLEKLQNGALTRYAHLYADTEKATERFVCAIETFRQTYGQGRDLYLFSVPGRSEISGNHTDHNHGRVLAAAIDRDIIAVVSPTEDGIIHLKSQGFPEDVVDTRKVDDPEAFPRYSSASIIAGMCHAMKQEGCVVGGFDAYTTTDVLKGSGLSSSAAFEVMCGSILNHLYANDRFDNPTLAKMAQYAENVFFGKPCGLMDQMACAVGGLLTIDFEDPKAPVITPLSYSLTEAGYRLCIVNTGGNHADLNEDYASVPAEMKSVAKVFGKETLRGLTEADILSRAAILRETVGDRALMRAIHFIRENDRVKVQAQHLQNGDTQAFLSLVKASGLSSFQYLQNVYTIKNVAEQGLSLALCVTEGWLGQHPCAWRVHGGGFAGTIQAFVTEELAPTYAQKMDEIFGEGATMTLRVRPVGATPITL